MTSTPRVHIVYVRNTVGRLLPFLESLLAHTDWRFTAVSNGCTSGELELLRAAQLRVGDRLEIHVISDDVVLRHGDVIEQLVMTESSPFFCCVDSDIFAMRTIDIAELLPAEDEVATCSCLPMWRAEHDDVMPDGFEIVAGRFLRTSTGVFLGCTYACCYRTEELRSTIERWGIPLGPADWDDLPGPVRAELDRRGLRRARYDTLKVANVLLHRPDRPMVYREIAGLLHLGAQSSLNEPASILRRPLRHLVWRRFPWVFRVLWRARGLSKAESIAMADFARRRGEAVQLADALVAGRAEFGDRPEWIGGHAEFEALAALLRPAGTGERARGGGRDRRRAKTRGGRPLIAAPVSVLKRITPWWAKIGLKIPLARLPVSKATWRRIGIFKFGDMTDPDVAAHKLAEHLQRAGLPGGEPFRLLELGPGDSLLTGLIAHGEHNCVRTFAVDVGNFAVLDLDLYRETSERLGLPVDGATTAVELLERAGCSYLTDGLDSLRSLPEGSVDLAISDAVLEHIRRAEFDETVREMYRVLADGGVASHAVDFEDHLTGELNSLRFSSCRWESRLFAESGFYTNRLRASEVLDSFSRAGFDIVSVDPVRWATLPTPRSRMHDEFAHLADDDLLTSSFRLVAVKPRQEATAR